MEQAVRAAFREQAKWCEQLGSPFTAQLCLSFAEGLAPESEIEKEILDWPEHPGATADALSLRIAGALHALVRAGKVPALARFYPPNPFDRDSLWREARAALREHADFVRAYLANAPQTNEVARSAVLLPGFLYIAELTRLPLDLYEIGASAGLNLLADRYRYHFGKETWGQASSPVVLQPEWQGRAPPLQAPLRIRSRQGADLNPLYLSSREARDRLLSFVWPDQFERLKRLEAAMQIAAKETPRVERAEAADWIERIIPLDTRDETVRVLFHSITWSYLPANAQACIEAHMLKCAAKSTAQHPLAWLRYEFPANGPLPMLRLTVWPAGKEILLATAHPHGAKIEWLV